MPKHALSFVEFHNPLFMSGSNLGNKLNAVMRGAKLLLDDERQVVWIHFKGKVSFVPLASVASADAVQIPDDIQALFGINQPEAAQEPSGPPAVKRGRGRPPTVIEEAPYVAQPVPYPDFDPNDLEAAARHRDLVRAASANSNRAQPHTQSNDDLIQQSRAAAMGIKYQKTSQVQTAQQVGESASVVGKKKPISHAELKAEK